MEPYVFRTSNPCMQSNIKRYACSILRVCLRGEDWSHSVESRQGISCNPQQVLEGWYCSVAFIFSPHNYSLLYDSEDTCLTRSGTNRHPKGNSSFVFESILCGQASHSPQPLKSPFEMDGTFSCQVNQSLKGSQKLAVYSYSHSPNIFSGGTLGSCNRK